MKWFRKLGKRLLAHFISVREYCHDCGRTTEAWRIDDQTWLAVVGRKDGDVFCLYCFDRRASKRGLHPVYLIMAENVPWRKEANGSALMDQELTITIRLSRNNHFVHILFNAEEVVAAQVMEYGDVITLLVHALNQRALDSVCGPGA